MGAAAEIAGNLPIGLAGAPGGLPTHTPTRVGVGASGTICFSSDIENAIYKVTKKEAEQLFRRGSANLPPEMEPRPPLIG